jgi:osmotically inducible protein OsmC
MADQAITRNANIQWTGDFAHGRGEISSGSGRLHGDYSFGTRFSGSPGTNPEELVGAAMASCYTMAFALVLGRANAVVERIDTKADVTLVQHEDNYDISEIHLRSTAFVNGVTADEFQRLAIVARDTCPMGKALRAVPIIIDANLAVSGPPRYEEPAV